MTLVRRGTAGRGYARQSVERHGLALLGVEWRCGASHGRASRGMAGHCMARHGGVWFGAVRQCTVWQGVAWVGEEPMDYEMKRWLMSHKDIQKIYARAAGLGCRGGAVQVPWQIKGERQFRNVLSNARSAVKLEAELGYEISPKHALQYARCEAAARHRVQRILAAGHELPDYLREYGESGTARQG